MIDRGYPQLIRRLESRGVTVVSLQPGTVDQMFVYWRILGRLSGREAAAEAMAARFKQTVQRIRRRTASIAHKKRVYFEAIHQRMRTFAPESMPIFVLETAGGINVAADAHPRRGTNIADFGKERILSRADAIDVYLAQVGPMNHPTAAMIRSEPGYGLIRAVRQDQIYLIDETEVSRPTLRMLAGICRMVQILYPQIWAAESDAMGCSSAAGTGPSVSAKNQKETKP
jgi:iron complex transport system substrate-binding protein